MPPKKKTKLNPFSELKPQYLQEIENEPNFYIRAPKEVKEDFDCTFTALSKNPQLFRYASPALKQNPELALKLIKKDPTFLFHNRTEHKLKETISTFFTRELAMESIQRGATLSSIPLEYSNDKEILMEAMKEASNYENFKMVPPLFLSDREMVLEIVKSSPPLIYHVDRNFLMDKEVILTAIRFNKNKWNLRFDFFEVNHLESDPDVQSALVGMASIHHVLMFSDSKFETFIRCKTFNGFGHFLTKETKIESIMENGCILHELQELSNDEEVCKLALKSNPYSLFFMSDRILKMRSMIFFALENGNKEFFRVMNGMMKGAVSKGFLKGKHLKNDHEMLNYCEFCKHMKFSDKKNVTSQFKDLKFIFQ
jgi:hypothetical protein